MRQTLSVYAKQLREAMELLKHHCSVDYNNNLQIRLAQEWFDSTLRSLVDGTDLPARPRGLLNQAQ